MQLKLFAILIGVLIGLAIAVDGFVGFAWAVFFGGAGWLVGAVLAGDLDPLGYIQSRRQQ